MLLGRRRCGHALARAAHRGCQRRTGGRGRRAARSAETLARPCVGLGDTSLPVAGALLREDGPAAARAIGLVPDHHAIAVLRALRGRRGRIEQGRSIAKALFACGGAVAGREQGRNDHHDRYDVRCSHRVMPFCPSGVGRACGRVEPLPRLGVEHGAVIPVADAGRNRATAGSNRLASSLSTGLAVRRKIGAA
jgi:hypothetical protein